jgi:thiamine-phosphate pyrophosphorylase
MRDTLTPAAQRTIDLCRELAGASTVAQTWCDFLMLALILDESLASAALKRLGVVAEVLLSERLALQELRDAAAYWRSKNEIATDEYLVDRTLSVSANDPPEFIRVLDRSVFLARRDSNANGASSAHLLMALLDTNQTLRLQLTNDGVDRHRILVELNMAANESQPPLPIDFDLNWSSDKVALEPRPLLGKDDVMPDMKKQTAWRIVDANLNRSREGLRVLEDYSRFALNDGRLSRELKDLRHQLVAAEKLLPTPIFGHRDSAPRNLLNEGLLFHRDTERDIGTQISTPTESIRNEISDVVTANCRRLQEALRSLEEFGKLFAAEFAANIKQIRYRSYSLQQELTAAFRSKETANMLEGRAERLQASVLYVLITESFCRLPWKHVVEASLLGGADVLQLREKHLSDRELLYRARWIADACLRAGCLFIVNDRADIAVSANADGVHVGQEELSASEARAVLRPDQLLGISTHTLSQAQLAESDGADYIGVGPTFPSVTKSFSEIPGLALVTEVSRNVQLPAFAIGGIGIENLNSVRQAGGNRVALTSCIAGSEDPAVTVRELKRLLTGQIVP